MATTAPEEQQQLAIRISTDFKIKECPAFVHFAGKQTRGAKVLAFNDTDIPLTTDAFNGKKQVCISSPHPSPSVLREWYAIPDDF